MFGKANVEKLTKRHDVEGLIRALGHQDASVRSSAALALGEIGDAAALDGLVELLRYEQGEPPEGADSPEACSVRMAAATALGTLGRAEAVDPLCHALEWVTGELIREAEAARSHHFVSLGPGPGGELFEKLARSALVAAQNYREEGLAEVEALRQLDDARSSTPVEAFTRALRQIDFTVAAGVGS